MVKPIFIVIVLLISLFSRMGSLFKSAIVDNSQLALVVNVADNILLTPSSSVDTTEETSNTDSQNKTSQMSLSQVLISIFGGSIGGAIVSAILSRLKEKKAAAINDENTVYQSIMPLLQKFIEDIEKPSITTSDAIDALETALDHPSLRHSKTRWNQLYKDSNIESLIAEMRNIYANNSTASHDAISTKISKYLCEHIDGIDKAKYRRQK